MGGLTARILGTVALLASVTACAKVQARTPAPAPLETPLPPPRVVVPVALTAPQTDPPPATPQPPAPIIAARPHDTPAPPPAPAKPPERTAPAPETAPSSDVLELERKTRSFLADAQRDLDRVAPSSLNADAKAQYDQARRFVLQAQDALKRKYYLYARDLAEKAANLASQLPKARKTAPSAIG